MSSPIETAYVEIRADTSKVGPDVRDGVQREMSKVGKKVTDSVAKPLEDASKRSTSAFSNVGSKISASFTPAVNQINAFKSGFNDSRAAASAFTGAIGSLGGVAKTALRPGIDAVNNFRAGFASSKAAASAFSGTMGTVGGVARSAFDTAKGAAQGFGTIGSAVADKLKSGFSNAANEVSGRMSSAFNKLKGSVLSIAGLLGAGGLGALLMSGFNRISDIEQTTKSLEVLTGSVGKAKKVMNDLLTFAKTTPFAFPDISEIGRNLIAFGVDTSKVIPILKALGDAASASGHGAEGLAQLGTVFGQIASKGKLQGEELLQLAEAGVPALKILANTAGISAAQMQKNISNGTVSSEFAIDALVKGIENGTKGVAGNTAKFGDIMLKQKDTIVGTMDSFKSAISSTMATLLTPAIPAFRASVNFVGQEFKKLPALFDSVKKSLGDLGFFDAIKNAFSGIASVVKAAWPIIQSFGKAFLTVFGAGVLTAIRAVGAVFNWLGGVIQKFQPVLQPIATVLGVLWGAMGVLKIVTLAMGGAMLVWKGIMVAFGPVMKIFTALQWALNVAMDANPISLIIIAIAALVAAFIILWNKSAGFRQFWIDLWDGIVSVVKTVVGALVTAWNAVVSGLTTAFNAVKTAALVVWNAIGSVISAVWTGFIKPVFDGFVAVFQAVGAAAQWLWTTILQPVFNFIGAAAVILGKIVLGIVLIPLVAFWQYVLGPAVMFLWHGVFEPAFTAIGNVVMFVINNVIMPVVNGLVNLFTVVLPGAALWLWHNVIEPVWNGIGNAISWVVNNILEPIWVGLKKEWQLLEDAAMWLWHNVIEPVWNGISNAISWVVNNILLPIWTGLKREWQLLQNALNFLWHNVVEPVWNGIGNAINWVWQNVILKAFNAIKDGLGKVGDVFSSVKDAVGRIWNQLGDIAMKPVRFVVNTVLDDGLIKGWNKVVDFLHLGFLHIPEIPRLATGGIVPGYTPGRDTHLAMLGGGEAIMRPEWTRAAGPGYVNAANAAARSGGVSGANAFIARNGLPGGTEMTRHSGGGIIPRYFLGGIFDWVGSAAKTVGNVVSGVASGIANIAGKVYDFVTDPVGAMTGLLNGILGESGDGGSEGLLSKLVIEAPKKMVGGLIQKISDWWKSFMGSAAQGGGGAGVQRWSSLVLQVLQMLGQPASLLPKVLRRMNQESSGNPNAFNGWDSNAKKGIPSQGLMQVIPPTFAAYAGPFVGRGIRDPLANIYAGLNYALHRYPSLAYAMDKPGGYDNGGSIPPGLSTVWNGTRRPENVRTADTEDETNNLLAEQNDLLRAMVASMAKSQPIQVMLNGKVVQTWFNDAETFGGM